MGMENKFGICYLWMTCWMHMNLHSERDMVGGEIFNLGGGIANSVSIYYEFFPILEKCWGERSRWVGGIAPWGSKGLRLKHPQG